MESQMRADAGVDGFMNLYEECRHKLFRTCLRILKDPADAEDTCQEIFIKAMRGWGAFEGRSNPVTWITSICLNECRTRLKVKKARALKLSAYAWEMEGAARPHDDLGILKASFERGKAALNPSLRRIVSLHVEEGLNHREIAERLRVSRVYITQSLGRIKWRPEGFGYRPTVLRRAPKAISA
jgi:RNA polymerase sigma-70 factor, ECF subfamily